jgi:sigma-B regulation protein RsbU (phosphoserine phosphatase)
MKMAEWFRKAELFVRARAGGFDGGEFQRLFDRDAARAFDVVTRDHARETEPESRVGRLFYRVRILFLGLAYKLSPPRRLLFVVSIGLAVWGLIGLDLDLDNLPRLRIDLLPLLSIAGLVFLLVLELADRVVVRDELEVARELQRELLPIAAPDVDGYSFAFSYRTANTIGGDYYDFFTLEDGRLAVITGDASGHGIAAGLVMAIAGSALKLGFDRDPDPVAVTRLVNRALCRTGGSRAFMTLFCGVLEPVTGRLRFVGAGHPFPLLRRADGEILELGKGCLPLGIRFELDLEAHEAQIDPGDTLLLYTDGVVETLGPSGETFGFKRLSAALTVGGSSRAIHDRVLREIEAFRQDEPVLDDLSLVVISRA